MTKTTGRLRLVRDALAEAVAHALNPLAVTPAKLNRWEKRWPEALAVLDQIIEATKLADAVEEREENRK